MKKFLLGLIGMLLAILAFYASMWIFAILFSIISLIPFLSSLLYWGTGQEIVQILAMNTLPIVIGALVSEKVGGKKSRIAFGIICVVLTVIDAGGIALGYVGMTLANVAAVVLFGITSISVTTAKSMN